MSELQDLEPFFGVWSLENRIGKGRAGTVYRISRPGPNGKAYAALKHIRLADSPALPAEAQAQALRRELEVNLGLQGEHHLASFEETEFLPSEEGMDVLLRMRLTLTLNWTRAFRRCCCG